MKRFLKITGIIMGALLTVGLIAFLILNESLPQGEMGPEAELLAEKMFDAIDHEAFENTQFLEWDMLGVHFYKWDKKLHKIEVSWDENKVILFPDSPEKNEVLKPENVSDKQKLKLYKTATDFFNNDSFWLIAPHKIYDKGVERRLVNYEGSDALLVTYTSGGSTPGDSYLWILDENGFPTSFKMWVSILPIGGIEATWEDWTTMESGLPIAKTRKISSFTLEMGSLKGYNELSDAAIQLSNPESE